MSHEANDDDKDAQFKSQSLELSQLFNGHGKFPSPGAVKKLGSGAVCKCPPWLRGFQGASRKTYAHLAKVAGAS